MKKIFLLLTLVPSMALAGITEELAALKALASSTPPWVEKQPDGSFKETRQPPARELYMWSGKRADDVAERALTIYESHPNAPERWEALAIALKSQRSFVTDIVGDPAKDGPKAFVRDEVAQERWDEKVKQLEGALFAASDVSPEVLADVAAYSVYMQGLRLGSKVRDEITEMKRKIELIEEKAPASRHLTFAYDRYLDWVVKQRPKMYDETLQELAQRGDTPVAQWAAGKIALQNAKEKPMEMKFTALDGREVDLAKLRGKVVLIDFWATWCGPCIAELPNVKAVYEKYHDRGFEVVAISLDSEKDKQKLIDYCTENELPWPQHFDGKGWKNEYAVKYSINGIPAMFLLDKSGRVVSTTARGEALEHEVRKQLGD